MSDDKLRDAIDRGKRALALTGDELLQEAFATLERRYIEEWKVRPVMDTAGREKLWQAVNIVGKVKEHLSSVLADGKLAQAEVDRVANEPRRKIFGVV